MDIDLFSEMIKNLILDNDEVTLPGLGTFVSEVMPSTFSDKGYTINPPYRRLSFRQRENAADSSLYDFYSKVNNLDDETSSKILGDFISGLREQLLAKKLVVLPGLGRLRATKENTFFFIADEDLDIYPYGYGLEPVSLKTHEETEEEVAAAVEELQQFVAPPADPSPKEPEKPAEPEPEKSAESQRLTYEFKKVDLKTKAKKRRKWRKLLIGLLIALGVAALALGIFVLLAHIAPDFIDSVLYTPEELRIINH